MKILVVDDDELLLWFLCRILQREKKLGAVIVINAGNGEEAVDLALKHQPELVLMDIKMPEMNGIDATRMILRNKPDCKVIALSGYYTKKGFVAEMLRAGALGFLAKSSACEELVQAICCIMDDRTYFCKEITPFVSEYLKKSISSDRGDFEISTLNGEDAAIVRLSTEGKTLKELSDILHLSVNCVAKRRERIKKKLKVDSFIELVRDK